MARDSLTRRRILYGSGVGMATALAGCTGGDGGDGGDGTPTTTATPADGGDGNGNGDGTPADGGTATPTETPDPADLPAVHMLTDYYGENWEPKWNSLVESFGSETGIGVNVEESGMSGQQESRLAQLIQAGTPPDINTSTFDQVADIWAGGDLVSTTDVVNSIADNAGELQTEPLRDENDDLFQIPHGMYVSTFHYRTDIYEELGLEEPDSFQTVLENAEAIENSEFQARGYGLAGARTGKSQDEFQVYLANMGTSGVGLRWVDPEARNELEIHFPEDKVVTLLEWFDEISQYSPDPTSITWTTSIRNYIQGQFAQQYHLNIWAFGAAAGAGVAPIANNTAVAPLPRYQEGGIGREDVWLYEPAPDGYHIFAGGDNTPGAKRYMEWLYAENMERTASMYAQEPSRFLPTYSDVLSSDPYQNMSFWQEWPDLLEQLQYVQNTILADYYGNVPESDLSSPIALYCTRQWFYGEMINQVVTDSMTPQEAYEWGLGRLETHIADAREQFGG